MKKLSVLMALTLALTAGPALAADYDLRVDNLSPAAGGTVTAEIRIDNWAGTDLQTFDLCLKYDSSVLSVNSMQINDTSAGGCAAAAFSIKADNGTDCARLGGGIFPGTTCTCGDDYLLATVVFDVNTDDETYICTGDCDAADDQPCGDDFPDYVEDETGKQYPAEVCQLLNAPLPCTLNIDPASATILTGGSAQFTAVETGECDAPNYQWSDTCQGDVDSNGLFTASGQTETCSVCVEDANNQDAGQACADVTVEPIPECTIDIRVEQVKAKPGDVNIKVPVSIKNPFDEVVGIETVIMDEGNLLTCTGCTPDAVRASGFMCLAFEQAFGECKVILVDPNSSKIIGLGDGPVFTVDYRVAGAIVDDCIDLEIKDTVIADINQESVKVCEIEETDDDICFITCGDVAPAAECGDGVVNIFDILEEIDFILGITVPSACQEAQANVPTSLPPDCVTPDPVGTQPDIFDVLVIIDKALGKDNCCDYYYFQ